MAKSTTHIENPHSRTSSEVLQLLETQQTGLTLTEVSQRQAIYGANSLPEAKRQSGIRRFLLQFHNILIYVLLASASITALLDHLIDTVVILAVVMTNAVIGFMQEGKAEQAMAAIRQMLAPKATVLRSGVRESVDGSTLVPGDIVLLEAGDKVPADLRLLVADSLTVQEAVLTGESVAIAKHEQLVAVTAPLGDRTCMAFSGTYVSSGQGVGIVVATGEQTEIGRISGLIAQVDTLTTPLVLQMGLFAKWLTFFILMIASFLLAHGYLTSQLPFAELFMAVVGLSVAAIPEGLPAVLTITLAVGVQAMAKRNAIVRRLPAIETLGAVSVICSDKTGTLTRNEMMVTTVLTSQNCFTLTGEGYAPFGDVLVAGKRVDAAQYPILNEIARAAALCNDAELKAVENGWQIFGDPMEGALRAFAGKILSFSELDASPRLAVIPFDAKYRLMATLHQNATQHVVFVKGAPEKILSMCHHSYGANQQTESIDNSYWREQADHMAMQGQRILAFAMKPVSKEIHTLGFSDVEDGLILLGMIGMIDPPRAEAVAAVAECYQAGIQVKMITGDHAKTAGAIAKQIGLHHADNVLTGADIDQLSEQDLAQAVLSCNVFARTSPEHKLRLVMALQANGLTVAMTGDGVNDAPALKRADAGIAMGQKGAETAKEAAELVLADDNFASIVAAVREGRTVYDNIRKVISWTLPTNAGEALTIIMALLLGLTLPITPVQILWINLITTITLGLALAFEPTEVGTMQRPPRARTESLLTASLVWHIILVSLLILVGVYGIYAYAIDQGYSLELARTLAVNTLVVMEIFHLFFIRNFYTSSLNWEAVRGTKVVWTVVGIALISQLAITYLTPLQKIFATEAMPFKDGLLVIVIGFCLFAIIESEKQLRLWWLRQDSHEFKE